MCAEKFAENNFKFTDRFGKLMTEICSSGKDKYNIYIATAFPPHYRIYNT